MPRLVITHRVEDMSLKLNFAAAAQAAFAMTLGLALAVPPLGNHAWASHTGDQLHVIIKHLDDQHDSHVADPDAHHVPTVDTDTSAADCGPGEVLTGDDACVDIAALICQVVGNVGDCAPDMTVFVTSMEFDGDLGGVAGADAKCQAAADAALSIVPSGTYLAWISDTLGISPSTRFTQTGSPYVLPDGTLVANDYADLIDGSLQHGIDVDEAGGSAIIALVWTGTDFGGNVRNGFNCLGWSSGNLAEDGEIGQTTQTGIDWTSAGFFDSCGIQQRLYCFQQ